MSEQHARSDRVLDATFVAELSDRSADELRGMHAECLELETEVSYVRRLTQARIDILEAEIGRRERGDSLEDLINNLPEILADSGPRGNPASSRLPMQMAPEQDSEWAPRLEAFDRTLTNLTVLSEDELRGAIDGLRALEREVSDQRRALFGVIDRIDLELADRLRTN
jgi:RsiG-like